MTASDRADQPAGFNEKRRIVFFDQQRPGDRPPRRRGCGGERGSLPSLIPVWTDRTLSGERPWRLQRAPRSGRYGQSPARGWSRSRPAPPARCGHIASGAGHETPAAAPRGRAVDLRHVSSARPRRHDLVGLPSIPAVGEKPDHLVCGRDPVCRQHRPRGADQTRHDLAEASAVDRILRQQSAPSAKGRAVGPRRECRAPKASTR